jgi:hypothetical protein
MVAGLTVVRETKISKTQGGLPSGNVAGGDQFGFSVSGVGDLDGDNTPDLVVGAVIGEDVHVLFLKSDGTVKSAKKITNPQLQSNDRFGASVSGVGDLDKDTYLDIAVGAHGGTEIPDLVVSSSLSSLHLFLSQSR